RRAADAGAAQPHRLRRHRTIATQPACESLGKLLCAPLPKKPRLDARQMRDAALASKLKALYVVGAKPVKSFGITAADRLGGLELLVVQEMFMTETAKRADIVFPAACAYEKDGTVTNTAGEVQWLGKSAEVMGVRSDFDILRILSHQLAKMGLGRAISLRTPEAALEEIRRNVSGYD